MDFDTWFSKLWDLFERRGLDMGEFDDSHLSDYHEAGDSPVETFRQLTKKNTTC